MAPHRVTGWATGAGLGFAALMLTWIIASRLASLLVGSGSGQVGALTIAVVISIAVALERGRALSSRATDGTARPKAVQVRGPTHEDG